MSSGLSCPGRSDSGSIGDSESTHVSLLLPPSWLETMWRSSPAMRDSPPGITR